MRLLLAGGSRAPVRAARTAQRRSPLLLSLDLITLILPRRRRRRRRRDLLCRVTLFSPSIWRQRVADTWSCRRRVRIFIELWDAVAEMTNSQRVDINELL